ncbi:MAG: hypothetical protein ACO1QR_05795 [Chthoniobacteraceae bacterium]
MKVRPSRVAWAIVGTLLVLVALSFLFPVVNVCGPDGKTAQAQQDVRGLTSALRAYKGHYGEFPKVSQVGRGDYRKTNAQLVKVLMAIDPAQNPRKIVFFEAMKADSRTRRAGIDPIDRAFLAPWGNPYHLRLPEQGDAGVSSPYEDEADPSPLREVLVWSLGRDGKQGRKNNVAAFKGSDDIASWR